VRGFLARHRRRALVSDPSTSTSHGCALVRPLGPRYDAAAAATVFVTNCSSGSTWCGWADVSSISWGTATPASPEATLPRSQCGLDLAEASARGTGRQTCCAGSTVCGHAAACVARRQRRPVFRTDAQWCNDRSLLRECAASAPGGLLTFTTSPDTLVELRRAWPSRTPRHVNGSSNARSRHALVRRVSPNRHDVDGIPDYDTCAT